jgi:hypothetical protein
MMQNQANMFDQALFGNMGFDPMNPNASQNHPQYTFVPFNTRQRAVSVLI